MEHWNGKVWSIVQWQTPKNRRVVEIPIAFAIAAKKIWIVKQAAVQSNGRIFDITLLTSLLIDTWLESSQKLSHAARLAGQGCAKSKRLRLLFCTTLGKKNSRLVRITILLYHMKSVIS